MPYTFAHPIAVAGVRGLPVSALVAGAVAPDWQLYLPTPVSHSFAHTVWGLFTVDLVYGFLLFAAWQWLLAPCYFAGLGVARVAWWRVLGALWLGSATHLLLDMPTHVSMLPRFTPDGMVSFLAADVLGQSVAKWLHLGLSGVGLLATLWWARRLFRVGARRWRAARRSYLYWLPLVAAVGWTVWELVGRVPSSTRPLVAVGYTFLTAPITGFFVAGVLCAVICGTLTGGRKR